MICKEINAAHLSRTYYMDKDNHPHTKTHLSFSGDNGEYISVPIESFDINTGIVLATDGNIYHLQNEEVIENFKQGLDAKHPDMSLSHRSKEAIDIISVINTDSPDGKYQITYIDQDDKTKNMNIKISLNNDSKKCPQIICDGEEFPLISAYYYEAKPTTPDVDIEPQYANLSLLYLDNERYKILQIDHLKTDILYAFDQTPEDVHSNKDFSKEMKTTESYIVEKNKLVRFGKSTEDLFFSSDIVVNDIKIGEDKESLILTLDNGESKSINLSSVDISDIQNMYIYNSDDFSTFFIAKKLEEEDFKNISEAIKNAHKANNNIVTVNNIKINDSESFVDKVKSINISSTVEWDASKKLPSLVYRIDNREIAEKDIQKNIFISTENEICVLPIKKDGKFTGDNKLLMTERSDIRDFGSINCSFPNKEEPTEISIKEKEGAEQKITPDVIDYKNKIAFYKGKVYHFEQDINPTGIGGADLENTLFVNPNRNNAASFLEKNSVSDVINDWDISSIKGKLYIQSSDRKYELQSLELQGPYLVGIAKDGISTCKLGMPSSKCNPNSPWKNAKSATTEGQLSLRQIFEESSVTAIINQVNDKIGTIPYKNITPKQLVRSLPQQCFVVIDSGIVDANNNKIYEIKFKFGDNIYGKKDSPESYQQIQDRIEKAFVIDSTTTDELLSKITKNEKIYALTNGPQMFIGNIDESESIQFIKESRLNPLNVFERDFAKNDAEVTPSEKNPSEAATNEI